MTFIHDLCLMILEMYLHTENELSRSKFSKVTALQTARETDTQTDATERITHAAFTGGVTTK